MSIIKGELYDERFDTDDIIQEALNKRKLQLTPDEQRAMALKSMAQRGLKPAKQKPRSWLKNRKAKPVTLPTFNCMKGEEVP